MDIEQAKTFLAIAALGSFLEAARHLHVTQSTVSARVQRLEDLLGVRLFVRNRSGAVLTMPGRRFVEYAKRLVRTAEQARQQVGLPSRYHASVHIGGRIAFWEGLLPAWQAWLRAQVSDVAIHSEIGFEEDLMRHLIEGTLDIGLMYTPSHSPGLAVEHLFDETLVLVGTDPAQRQPGEHYIHVEWGAAFDIQHTQSYPDMEPPPQVVNVGWLGVQLMLANGGSCYLPARMAAPLVAAGRLYVIADAPRYVHPAYMVYSKTADQPVIARALEGLRLMARQI